MRRRLICLALPGLALLAPLGHAATPQGDPFGSLAWPDLAREHFGAKAKVVFDERVQVQVPAFAEDPMNVPVTVRVKDLAEVEQITVIVDRNPIRKVLELFPQPGSGAMPAVSFRFKLEQASPVRAAVRTKDGVWHVGGALVDSAGGGCTVSGATRKDGTWSQTLGQVQGKLFSEPGSSPRLRVRLMHPMDTGLVAGIPAFYVNKLSVRDGSGRELLRLQPYEPVSENPVFSFDFAQAPQGGVQLVGTDNNGNRISSRIE